MSTKKLWSYTARRTVVTQYDDGQIEVWFDGKSMLQGQTDIDPAIWRQVIADLADGIASLRGFEIDGEYKRGYRKALDDAAEMRDAPIQP